MRNRTNEIYFPIILQGLDQVVLHLLLFIISLIFKVRFEIYLKYLNPHTAL